MAIVKLEQSIVSIRGRSGGNYFRNVGGQQHISAMPRTVQYTRKGVQGLARDGYTTMAAFWHLFLLSVFWAAWSIYAAAYTYKTGKHISGYNWYIHYWLLFPEEERLPFWQPPHSPSDLPDHIVTYQGRKMYYMSPDQWETWAPSGFYWDSGIPWNGKPFYRTDDLLHFIWWNNTDWVLSQGVGFEPAGRTFYNTTPGIIGYYLNAVTHTRAHCYVGKRPGL